jgi:23S rRNA (guanosine2251-2'-O)-methyltransferase
MEQIMDGLGKLVEGINSVEAALETNRVNEIIILRTKNKSNRFDSLIDIAQKKKIKIIEVMNKRDWEYNDRHKVVAICSPLQTYKESDIKKFKSSNFIVCDHIQDTNNLGAIVRSAAAFGFNVLAIPSKRSVKLSEKIFSISAGGLERVNILIYNSIFSLIKKLNDLDIWTIGLDMSGETIIKDINFNEQNVAIFLGSEEKGISKEVKNKLDLISQIQMLNNTESLNVSVAAAIAMHEIFIKK